MMSEYKYEIGAKVKFRFAPMNTTAKKVKKYLGVITGRGQAMSPTGTRSRRAYSIEITADPQPIVYNVLETSIVGLART